MQQESISNHFKNIKRKSAVEAKEKISSINGTSLNKPAKQGVDTHKAVKIIPESQNNLNRINLENAALPLKRRSTRNSNNNTNKSEESEFEIPKNLEKSKKLNLEETINKKRKREEESVKDIKAAKAQLMQKSAKNAKKNGKSEFNESFVDENSMEIDDLPAKIKQQKEKKNLRKSKLEDSDARSNRRLVNNDISEETKNVVKKIMESKSRQTENKEDDVELAEFNLDTRNNDNNLNNCKARNDSSSNYDNKYRNISADKNYISDDVLDTVEETLKNKKAKNLISKISDNYNNYNLALRERRNNNNNNTNNNSKAPNYKGNIANTNINEESSQKSPNCNSFLSTNSTDLNNASQTSNPKTANRKNAKNESINNINNNFESPSSYIFNKINSNFSFDDEAANQETKNNVKNAKNNKNLNADNKKETTQKSLLLSMEANKSEFKKPELSEQTLRVIDEINKLKERKNNFKREEAKPSERDRSQSSFSLKFKYEELVKNERELLLPPSYKKLLNKFTQLDQTLNFFKISKSNKVPSFPEIKRSIEITYKEDFEFEHFLKMLYIVPHFFVYSWEKLNNAEKDYSLLIGIPSKFEEKMNAKYTSDFDFLQMQTKYEPCYEPLSKEILEKRKMIFKNILLEIVNFHHKEFLKSQNFSRAFDPFKLKTWHSSFNLETDVTEIPIFEIAEKPIIKIVKMSEFINNNDFKSDLIERAIEECSKENAKEKEKCESEGYHSSQENKDRDSILPSYISNKLLQKIKAKEKAVKMHNDIIEYSTQKSKQKSRLLDLKDFIDRIKNIFIMKNHATIPMNELCEKIQSGSNSISSVDSIDTIKNLIFALTEHFSNFLTIKDHQVIGTVVKLNQNANIKDILQEIEDKNLADKIYGL